MKEFTFKGRDELAKDMGINTYSAAATSNYMDQYNGFSHVYSDADATDAIDKMLENMDSQLMQFDLEIERGVFPGYMTSGDLVYYRVVRIVHD